MWKITWEKDVEEAQENTKMFKTTENKTKEVKVTNGRKTSRFKGN